MLLKLKNKSCPNIKRLTHSFYNLKVKCISIIFVCYSFVEIKFNINPCTHVTKYTIILNVNFSHTIIPQWRIMPLYGWQRSFMVCRRCRHMPPPPKKKLYFYAPIQVESIYISASILLSVWTTKLDLGTT